jgi:hypothetical protein
MYTSVTKNGRFKPAVSMRLAAERSAQFLLVVRCHGDDPSIRNQSLCVIKNAAPPPDPLGGGEGGALQVGRTVLFTIERKLHD